MGTRGTDCLSALSFIELKCLAPLDSPKRKRPAEHRGSVLGVPSTPTPHPRPSRQPLPLPACSGESVLFPSFCCSGLWKRVLLPFYVLGLTSSPFKPNC